ncbi:hypothetical protein CK203_112015 [Vitis vinifera]|uniref:Disease resistance protein n=1 Tax=Vitis vinifera TaxID=29760 RepID=A0A438CU18_VITVI|nr:hypothetical protein CK203_112015 [Vitis vinifera]
MPYKPQGAPHRRLWRSGVFSKKRVVHPQPQAPSYWRCVNLRSGVLSRTGLPANLTSLYVGWCENLKKPISEWSLYTFTSLSALTICRVFPNMASFSDEECLLPPSLTYLSISELESLTSMALQNLVSLKELAIYWCRKLRSLELPATLGRLEISDCPIIKESCSKEKEDIGPTSPTSPAFK